MVIKKNIKKKLKDITLEEYKDWRIKHCINFSINFKDDHDTCYACPFESVICNASDKNTWINNKYLYSDNFLNQEIDIEVSNILTDKEKEYLKSIIKPFKDKIICIGKQKKLVFHNDMYRIKIIVESIEPKMEEEVIFLPFFPKESNMYSGMEFNKRYTLKDLGL